MKWSVVLPLLFKEREGLPHVLVVHLEGNDLGLLKGKALILQIKADLVTIQNQWTGVQIDCILPCFLWYNSGNPRCLEQVRHIANHDMKVALDTDLKMYVNKQYWRGGGGGGEN